MSTTDTSQLGVLALLFGPALGLLWGVVLGIALGNLALGIGLGLVLGASIATVVIVRSSARAARAPRDDR